MTVRSRLVPSVVTWRQKPSRRLATDTFKSQHRAASGGRPARDRRTAPYGVEVEEELVSDFLAGVGDVDDSLDDDDDELVALDEPESPVFPESPFFDSVVDVAVDGVFDDDLPRLSVL